MSSRPDLSIVIPVHNAANAIASLVSDCLLLDGVNVEVLLVDDASTDGSDRIVMDLAAYDDRVNAICLSENRGAGTARNLGFDRVCGRYTLFFDADDVLHGEALSSVIPCLDESSADVGFMAYRYRRGKAMADEAMNDRDIKVWRQAFSGTRLQIVRLDEFPELLGFSNYPWNKVLRTDRYREIGLRFGDTLVHNDILGHWHTLLSARSVLLFDKVVCTHLVEPEGLNLSNRKNDQRLQLFDALNATYRLLEEDEQSRSRYAVQYWDFVLRVSGWARTRIDTRYEFEFNRLLRDHLLNINVSDFAAMRASKNPSLAIRIVERALR